MTAATTPGIDGPVLAGRLPLDPCCPPTVCGIDDCGFVCNFVQAALPDGPLWDVAKEAFNAHRLNGCLAPPTPFCSDLVGYAAFYAKVVLRHVRGALWPMVREASPFTAWTTRQAWLDRWGWSNCFLDPNRPDSLGPLTPYEVVAQQGCEPIDEQGALAVSTKAPAPRILNPPPIPAELQDAVTHGTIVALARRSLGPVPNLGSLNFIIAPLGAVLSVETPFDVWAAVDRRREAFCNVIDTITGAVTASPPGLAIEDFEEQGAGAGFDPIAGPYRSFCRGASADCVTSGCIDPADDEQGRGDGGCCLFDVPLHMMIEPASDTIARFVELSCAGPSQVEPSASYAEAAMPPGADQIPAYFEPTDPAYPGRIYPGVLAAECIVRSILPDTMPYTLRRCAEPVHVGTCP